MNNKTVKLRQTERCLLCNNIRFSFKYSGRPTAFEYIHCIEVMVAVLYLTLY